LPKHVGHCVWLY